MNEYGQFIRNFCISFFSILGAYLLLLTYVNPTQTFDLFGENIFSPYNSNFIFNKAKKMESSNNFDTVIIGSSTSGSFDPVDVDYYFSAKTFTASTGGGNTPTRFALLQSALHNFKDLKRIIYISDLFEFNRSEVSNEVAYNPLLRNYLGELYQEKLSLKRVKHVFSNQTFESIFDVIKKYSKDTKTDINENGSTNRSMVLSPIKNSNNFFSTISSETKKELMKQILENHSTYSRSVLNNFEELSPSTKNYFHAMNALARSRNIQIIYILSPYHHDFREMLFKDSKIADRYFEWQVLFKQFNQQDHIYVMNPLNQVIATDPMSGVWRDGIHFNRQTAAHLLEEITKDLNIVSAQASNTK